MVKASARQKAGSQHPEGFDKTESVFIPNYDRAPGFQVVHKGKICMKYLSLSKNKNKPNPANAWTQSIFSCNIQKLLKNWLGNCFRKGQNLPNCLFPKALGALWRRQTDILLKSDWNHLRARVISQKRADLEFCCPSPISSQPGCSRKDQWVIPGLCSFPGVGSLLCSDIDDLDHSPQCQKEKEAAHCLSPILPQIKPCRKGKGSFHFLKGS